MARQAAERSPEALRRLILPGFDNSTRASIGVAHIDLIEHVIECLPIVHLGIQTAGEQAAHTKAHSTPYRSTSRAGERLRVSRDRNWTAIHWTLSYVPSCSRIFRVNCYFLNRPGTIFARHPSQDASI